MIPNPNPNPFRRLVEDHGRKFIRYSGVSVVTIGVGQFLLLVLHGLLHQPAWSANVIAVAVSAIPGYVLNRYLVWGKRSSNSVMAEIVPFWAVAFLGLVVSTLAVAWAGARWDSPVAVNGAYLAAFGTLWLFKYGAFERWLFGTRPEQAAPAPSAGGTRA